MARNSLFLSVQCLFSMVSYRTHMARSCKISFSSSQHGMLMPSYIYTPPIPSISLTQPQNHSAEWYISFWMRLAKLILHLNSPKKQLRVAGDLQHSQARAVLLFPRNQLNTSTGSWTCKCTSTMHWEITQIQFGSKVLQTTTQHNQ